MRCLTPWCADKGIPRSSASCSSHTPVYEYKLTYTRFLIPGLVISAVLPGSDIQFRCMHGRLIRSLTLCGVAPACTCECHETPIRIVRLNSRLRPSTSMSVYDPYSGRYRSPSVWSYSYAPSNPPLSAYADSYYNTTRDFATGQVSERMYFNLNGKLVRSYKIRNYRVCPFVFASGAMLTLKCGFRGHRDKP